MGGKKKSLGAVPNSVKSMEQEGSDSTVSYLFNNTICWIPLKRRSYAKRRPTAAVCQSVNGTAAVQTSAVFKVMPK